MTRRRAPSKREGWNLSWMPPLPDPATRPVFPGGVPLFNEPDFSGADPALDLFLAGNSGANLREPFEMDQPSDVVLAREPGDQATLVLIYSSHDVVGDPGVQDTRATGHDVHAVAAHDLLQSCTMPRDQHRYSAPCPPNHASGWLLAIARQRPYSPRPPPTEMRYAPTQHLPHARRRRTRLPGSPPTAGHPLRGQACDRRRQCELASPDRRGPRRLARPILPSQRGDPAAEYAGDARARLDSGVLRGPEHRVQPASRAHHPRRVGAGERADGRGAGTLALRVGRRRQA